MGHLLIGYILHYIQFILLEREGSIEHPDGAKQKRVGVNCAGYR